MNYVPHAERLVFIYAKRIGLPFSTVDEKPWIGRRSCPRWFHISLHPLQQLLSGSFAVWQKTPLCTSQDHQYLWPALGVKTVGSNVYK